MKLKNNGAVGAAALMLFSTTISAEPITVVSWGGSYGAAQDNALFNDASKNTGIEINRESGASMSNGKVIMATVKKGVDAGEVEAQIDAIIDRLLEQGPTEEELGRAKARFLSSFARGMERLGGFE